MTTPAQTPPTEGGHSFADTGIDARITAILTKKEVVTPTPIQAQAIPVIVGGSDCIGIAQTGTGKTLAFVLPLVQKLLADPQTDALILAPTRELAYQIQEICEWFRYSFKLYSTVIVGGAPMGKQISDLKRKPRIIIATPGRLIDHLERKTVNLSRMHLLVFDEADRMFDMGFAPQIRRILAHIPKKEQRQTLIFSATMPDAVTNLIEEHMREPLRIEVTAPGTTAKDIHQEIIILENEHRKNALLELIRQTKDSILVFTRTKHQAKQLNQFLRNEGYKSEELHGNRSLPQRKKAVAAMQSKKAQILVATDVAARGIDIPHLKLVINYELPTDPEDYIHRIGRTGRAGQSGRSVSFVLSDQHEELRNIQRLINLTIEQTHLETIPTAQLRLGAGKKKSYRGGSGKPRSGGGSRRGPQQGRWSRNRGSGGKRAARPRSS